jgi:hypothetical protein
MGHPEQIRAEGQDGISTGDADAEARVHCRHALSVLVVPRSGSLRGHQPPTLIILDLRLDSTSTVAG